MVENPGSMFLIPNSCCASGSIDFWKDLKEFLYKNLPIFRASMRLCVYLEDAIRGFERYRADLRNCARET